MDRIPAVDLKKIDSIQKLRGPMATATASTTATANLQVRVVYTTSG
jgi:hypothetical protein